MAVKKPTASTQQLLRDFWPQYHRFAVIATVLMQGAVLLIVATSLLISGVEVTESSFWITILATAAVSTSLNLVLTLQLLIPLKDLTNAITSAAGEKPRYPLANPNTPRYTKDGFRTILQFIYEGASAKNKASQPTATSRDASVPLLSALSHTNAGVVVMDASGRIVYANRAAPVKQTADGHQQLTLLFEPEKAFHDWLKNCRKSTVRGEQTWYRVADRIVGNDERRIFNVSASYEKGSAAEVVLVLFDASDSYRPEDEDLDFISFAAHELRGPITIIRGYLDVLEIELSEHLTADQEELFDRLVVSANRLTAYVNNILNASKYDRRHLQVRLNEDTIAAVYRTIRDDMALRASSQRRILAVDIPTDLPTVAIDHSSISEVIGNLIDNAIKFSSEGSTVAINAKQEGEFVKVSVADNGIGIPANIIGNLFQKFYRSHRSRESVAGTGIGLYICKAIVESHGGSIEVVSTEGKGSTFSFTVPTYASVADKLRSSDHANTDLISTNEGWIRNHAKFKG